MKKPNGKAKSSVPRISEASIDKKRERNNLTRTIRALRSVCESHRCSPRSAIGTVLTDWCASQFPRLSSPTLPYSHAFSRDKAVSTFVANLQSMEFIEGAYWASSLYAALTEQGYRKRLAMFFTPSSLTRGLLDDLVEQGVDFTKHSFVDPACGGAAFLVPIAMRMRDALVSKNLSPKLVLKHIERSLYGRDVDEVLCELSRHFLRMALYKEICNTSFEPKFRVFRGDSLKDFTSMYGTVDVVVCNPPYRKIATSELSLAKKLFEEVIEAQPNLYGLFIGLCVQLLRRGGYAALVTPTSFLSGQYFRKLRTFLKQKTQVEHIGMVSDRQGVFFDVEQETALTILRKISIRKPTRDETKVSVVSADGAYVDIGKCSLPGAGLPWPIPRTIGDVALLGAASAANFRLSDYGYRIRIGSYVWNRDKRPRFESIKAVKQAKTKTALPLLWSRDITAGGYVQFDELQMTGEEHRFVDLGDKLHSSVVTRPSLVVQRVSSNDQPKRLVAAAVPYRLIETYGGFIGENHIVILEQTEEWSAFDTREMVKLLGTTPVDRYFRCISGATNVSAFELAQLLLPNPTVLRRQLKHGHSMEEAVYRSYGIEQND